MRAHTLPDGKIVFYLCGYALGYGNEPVFFKLGPFDILGCILPAVMRPNLFLGFLYPQAARGIEHNDLLLCKIGEKKRLLFSQSLTEGLQ